MGTFDPVEQFVLEHGFPTAKDDLIQEKYVAEQTGRLTRFEVTPHPHPLIGTRWEVTIGDQAHPIASMLTQMQAIEAARVAIDVVEHPGQIRVDERDGYAREVRSFPGYRYPFPSRA